MTLAVRSTIRSELPRVASFLPAALGAPNARHGTFTFGTERSCSARRLGLRTQVLVHGVEADLPVVTLQRLVEGLVVGVHAFVHETDGVEAVRQLVDE